MDVIHEFLKKECRTVMMKDYLTVSQDTPVQKIISFMQSEDDRPRAMLVKKESKIVGIITEGCFLRLLSGTSTEFHLKKTLIQFNWDELQAHDVMRKVSTHVHEDDPIKKALRLMNKFDLYILPVQESHKGPISGVVSLHKILGKIAEFKSNQEPI